jgi:glucokinase
MPPICEERYLVKQPDMRAENVGTVPGNWSTPSDSLPLVVGVDPGVVFAPPTLPGWDNVPLRDLFHERFGVPIFVKNDANFATLAEYLFGAGRGCKELVYMTISTGIGGGIITDGKILEGISGTAAELGHMTIDWQGERCNCGNIGCLEHIASGTAIARYANEAIAMGRGDALLAFARSRYLEDETANTPGNNAAAAANPVQINARTIAQAAEAGIPLACTIISKAAEALGRDAQRDNSKQTV